MNQQGVTSEAAICRGLRDLPEFDGAAEHAPLRQSCYLQYRHRSVFADRALKPRRA
ncbi:hypothetical protein P0D87_02740 [Paraburkholderia sp. RL17-368-BIF-A]